MGSAGTRSLAVAACLAAAMTIPGLTTAAAADLEAMDAFAALEDRLLRAGTVEMSFDIRATGALDAALAGTAVVSASGEVVLTGEGTFAGAAADIGLRSVEGSMRGGNGGQTFVSPAPPALQEALLLGVTRMGLLHNLAVLSAGSPPDKTDGTLREWVTVEDIVLEDATPIGGVPTRAFSFTVVVGGQPSALARLWVDADTGMPIRRTQTVSFPEGEMRVLEQYPTFRLISPD
jgi:hypothetical protein